MNDAMNDAVHAHPRFADALEFWLKLGLMLLTGPEATQLATYVGWLLHRTPGGLIAGLLFVLPSIFILLALSYIYVAYVSVPVVAALFYGLKPAVLPIAATGLGLAYRMQ